MELSQIMKSRRKELGLTLKDISIAIGVSEPTVQRWESGVIRTVRPKNLEKLAQVLQMTPGELMGFSEPKNNRGGLPGVMVPVLGTIKAGWDGSILAEHIGFEPAYGLISPENHTWLVVSGDSMSPDINDGDYVLIKKQQCAENGDYVAAILGGENATIKIYQKNEDGILLSPKNPSYPFVFVPKTRENELYIYGIAVELKRKF